MGERIVPTYVPRPLTPHRVSPSVHCVTDELVLGPSHPLGSTKLLPVAVNGRDRRPEFGDEFTVLGGHLVVSDNERPVISPFGVLAEQIGVLHPSSTQILVRRGTESALAQLSREPVVDALIDDEQPMQSSSQLVRLDLLPPSASVLDLRRGEVEALA
jgi:hypothetical protein